MRQRLRLLGIAVQFSTRMPVPDVGLGEGELRRASAAFPLVGVAVAGTGIAVRGLAGLVWGPVVGTVVAVIAMVAVTGALHEDGLADTVDGLWGAGDPHARLAVMRDSRIGTYGTVAVFAVLALRAALLAPLDLTAFSRAVLAGHVLGRAAMLALVRVVPVLPGSSSGLVAGPLTSAGAAVALLTVAVAAVVGAGVWAPGVVALCLLALAACARLFRLRLGGCNGDTLGAANQVIDLVAVASIAALVRADLL